MSVTSLLFNLGDKKDLLSKEEKISKQIKTYLEEPIVLDRLNKFTKFNFSMEKCLFILKQCCFPRFIFLLSPPPLPSSRHVQLPQNDTNLNALRLTVVILMIYFLHMDLTAHNPCSPYNLVGGFNQYRYKMLLAFSVGFLLFRVCFDYQHTQAVSLFVLL